MQCINKDYLIKVLEHYQYRVDCLLQLLIDLQDHYRCVPEDAVLFLADALKIPVTRIRGLIEFYSFLSSSPVGRYDIRLSRSITDQMLGCELLAEEFSRVFNVSMGSLRDDGLVSLSWTSCTGICDQGPAALINGFAVPRLEGKVINEIGELISNAIPVSTWPQHLLSVEDNIRLAGPLLETRFRPGDVLHKVIKEGAISILSELEISGLRGRGGAGFNTAKKWSICREEAVPIPRDRVIVCNADEGEPGTFKDRVLLNAFADQVLEGMTLAAFLVGASKGFIYLRGEYRHLECQLRALLDKRRRLGLLGQNILNEPNFDFDIELHMGAGAYICGEESALIESLEGKRGIPRNRPPFPVTHGYMGKPTVVNNVETFLASALIAFKGGSWFSSFGTPSSRGTKLLSISGDCERPGIYEYPFGTSLRSILADCGASDGLLGVQMGGPSGLFVSTRELDRCIGYEDLSTGGSMIVFNDQRDLLSIVGNFMAFFEHESCGFCAPCRIGTTLMREVLDKIRSCQGSTSDLCQLMELAKQVGHASHCGLGLSSVNPIISTMASMSEHYELMLTHQNFQPGFDLDASLAEARELTKRSDAGAYLDQRS